MSGGEVFYVPPMGECLGGVLPPMEPTPGGGSFPPFMQKGGGEVGENFPPMDQTHGGEVDFVNFASPPYGGEVRRGQNRFPPTMGGK